MAASFVRSVGDYQGPVSSIELSFGSAAAEGHFLGWQAHVYDEDLANPGTAVPSGLGTWEPTAAANKDPNENSRPYISFNKSCSAGTGPVTGDYGLAFYFNGVMSEWADVDNSSPLHQEATNSGTSDVPTSGATGATTQADTLSLAVLVLNSSSSPLGINLPSGFTNLRIEQNGSDIGVSCDYKIETVIGVKSAGWGSLSGSYYYAAKIANFKAAAVSGTSFTQLERGVRGLLRGLVTGLRR